MKMIFRYMGKYIKPITFDMFLKLCATVAELLIPYVLEYLIDEIVPLGEVSRIILWGGIMIFVAFLCWQFNRNANRLAVRNAHNVSYDVRKDLFDKTMHLSGAQFDAFGLPSLTSRMTSDSYNVQSFAQSFQTMCVRAPIMLVGGIIVTMTMDPVLSGILCVMLPLLAVVILTVSSRGIPLYHKVQERLDDVVRIMRENITGIRVVKALCRMDYERDRFHQYNDKMMAADVKASTVMAIPGPFMQICLNTGLSLVVYVGAMRVNSGVMKPGVILAFLTYFNLILQSVMSINRIFMMISRASASANRIDLVLQSDVDQKVLSTEETFEPEAQDAYIVFKHVNFKYPHNLLSVEGKKEENTAVAAQEEEDDGFFGGEQGQCLYDIDFKLKKGESLGIIGPTGCGKTTIINLLMRFYDVEDGGVYIDGRDVRTYRMDELRSKFGVVFQNDQIFQDTLRNNIAFGRDVNDEQIHAAAVDAMAAEFIDSLDDGLDHMADIKGANLSGGQKQRVLISRSLAANPDILILDDSSSALDYKTDAALRKAIFENHSNSTTIMVAQRVSSIMNMTHIMVMDEGHCIGYGTHEELLKTCPVYKEIYTVQMGAIAG
ncbi:MAG: ABC transporter ATP-binding protein/permease [Lachnospiraceae bacterium]|nr:ABC transporter ATP-binding protein/permease [Lachnospiraceae bacterium]